MSIPELKGLATGIGSLPHKEVKSALELIFRNCPSLPFWPQLPKRSPCEGMVAQFSENIPFIKASQNGVNFSAFDSAEGELERFYEHIIANDLDYFSISREFALGLHEFYQYLQGSDLGGVSFIKCHVTGPFSFAAALKDDKGASLLYDAVFMQAALKGLIMKALWQIKLFKKFSKKIIMFFDEPFLGCFGSAYTPINRQDVVSSLSEFTQGIKQSPDTLVGVHCCGNTDWSIFTDIPKIDIINFDAFGFQERFVLYAEGLKRFLDRGGLICWGIIPTQDYSGQETPELLVNKIEQGIDSLVKKGLDRNLLLNNMLLSPSCGLGTLDTGKSERIFKLLSETSALARKSL